MSRRQQTKEWIIEFFKVNGMWPSGSKAASAFGYNLRDTHRIISKLKKAAGEAKSCKAEQPEDTIQRIIESDKFHLIVNSLTINTVEQALAAAEVDLDFWEIKNSRINSWQVHMKVRDIATGGDSLEKRTNYQVRIDLVPKVATISDQSMKLLIDQLIKGYTPVKIKSSTKPGGEYMLEIALFDAHFGKLAWDKETRQGDYDIEIAEDVYVKACENLIQHATSHKIEKILFPFGNDFFHVNNPEGTTPTGKHQLDMDTRLPKIWTAGKMAVLKAIDLCAQVAPVEVLWIPGNHDPDTSWFLTEVIKAIHSGNPHITVDNTPSWRKARLYGQFLVAFAHAATEKVQKLPNIMMVEFRDLMAKAKYCEWHIGHLHKKDEFKFQPTVTEGGIIVRRIPALSRIDAWHYKYGFVDAVRAGEAFLIHKDHGVVNHITCNV